MDLQGYGSTKEPLDKIMLRRVADGLKPAEKLAGAFTYVEPFNEAQRLCLESPADVIFFGGAAGGGKSWTLLMIALERQLDSVIYRRTYPQLSQIIKDSRRILRGRASYNVTEKLWTGLEGGRALKFRSVEHEKNIDDYQGHAHDYIGFDELPHFTENMFRTLAGWNRTPVIGQRTRVVATGNPPGDSQGYWIIDYWGPWLDPQHPRPAAPGELVWFARVDDRDLIVDGPEPFEHNGALIEPHSRTFIPARVFDNPVYMQTDYVKRLQALPEPRRSQLLYGDFTIGQNDHEWQVIPTAAIRAAQQRWRQGVGVTERITAVGVDIARGGQDKTVIAKLYGSFFPKPIEIDGKDTPTGPAAADAVMAAVGNEAPPLFIDALGVGASAYDDLMARYAGDVVAVNASAKSEEFDASEILGFRNLRAELWWQFREALLDPDSVISLPPNRALQAELTAPHYRSVSGKIVIEEKSEIKKRLGRSTDIADAVIMAWWGSQRPKRWIY